MNKKLSTNTLIKISLLSAIAVILMFLEIVIFPGTFDWLKLDISDAPVLIGAFAYGPLVGVVIEGMKNILAFFVKGSHTAGIGELANFIIGSAIAIPAGLIYSKNKTRKNAIVGLIIGTLSMTIVGALANYFVLVPLYKNFLTSLKDSAYVSYYLTAGVVPFNLIKGTLISTVTVLIYKRVSAFIIKESTNSRTNGSDERIA